MRVPGREIHHHTYISVIWVTSLGTMAKRNNEHAQMSKEEYDAMSNNVLVREPSGSRSLASPEVLSQRRIVSVKKARRVPVGYVFFL